MDQVKTFQLMNVIRSPGTLRCDNKKFLMVVPFTQCMSCFEMWLVCGGLFPIEMPHVQGVIGIAG